MIVHSLFGTQAVHSPQQEVPRIDEDYSDQKVLRVGVTKNQGGDVSAEQRTRV
jgi:hypothetical protein